MSDPEWEAELERIGREHDEKPLREAARQRALLDGMRALRNWSLSGIHDEIAYANALAAFLAAGGRLDE